MFCLYVSHLDGFIEHRGCRGRADIGYFMLTAALHYNRGEVFLLYMNVRVLQKLRVLHKFSFTARIYLFFIWNEALSEWFCSRVKCIERQKACLLSIVHFTDAAGKRSRKHLRLEYPHVIVQRSEGVKTFLAAASSSGSQKGANRHEFDRGFAVCSTDISFKLLGAWDFCFLNCFLNSSEENERLGTEV